ncbi:MAG: DUF2807 domain-containing protein [Anaerolineales bacterium]|nr:DUF2807 domain-containing protein [Anaerolineales bacterium]
MAKMSIWMMILALALTSLACTITLQLPGFERVSGSGNVILVEREVSGFTAVDFGGVGTLHIEVADEEVLRIEAEDNLTQYIVTEVRGERLHIELRENVSIDPTQPIHYYLKVKTLDSIAVSGLGSVEALDLSADHFAVTISGSGDVQIEGLKADDLKVVISGLGNLSIGGGEVERQDIVISGSGGYQARELKSAQADLLISGLGSATVWAEEHLQVSISGSGSVRYVGDPTVKYEISGLGRLERIDE